jgi:predicted nucleotidyltransferase
MYDKTIVLKAYTGNCRQGFHVRELAKILNISPSAVSYMTKNLEKQRILNCRTEGRNRKYFINFTNPAAKTLVAGAEMTKAAELIRKHIIIKKLADEIDFNGVTLIFGSFAKNTAKEESDIDLLLIGKKDRKIGKNIYDFGKLYRRQIHLISMTDDDFLKNEKKEFVNEVIKNHVVLGGAEKFVDMMWRLCHER